MLYWIFKFWESAHKLEIEQGVQGWAHTFDALNLFRYITFRAAVACLLAFAISVIAGPRVIRKLISLKVGQPVRTAAEVHKLAELHGGKIGTPTMGGVLILGAVLVATLVCANPLNPFVAVCACTMTTKK
jgi:phospho-N-acetylmuramoyl-pentapeptide-transferase